MVDIDRSRRDDEDSGRRYAIVSPARDVWRRVTCFCGTVLRVAGSWTCFTCGVCHRLHESEGE